MIKVLQVTRNVGQRVKELEVHHNKGPLALNMETKIKIDHKGEGIYKDINEERTLK